MKTMELWCIKCCLVNKILQGSWRKLIWNAISNISGVLKKAIKTDGISFPSLVLCSAVHTPLGYNPIPIQQFKFLWLICKVHCFFTAGAGEKTPIPFQFGKTIFCEPAATTRENNSIRIRAKKETGCGQDLRATTQSHSIIPTLTDVNHSSRTTVSSKRLFTDLK